MYVFPDCIPCHFNQMSRIIKSLNVSEEESFLLYKKVAEEFSKMENNITPVEMADILYTVVEEQKGVRDVFYNEKKLIVFGQTRTTRKGNIMSYHTIILVGRLGRDPELRFTPTGQAVCNLSVATDHSYTGRDGQRVTQTTWFRVTVWGKQAETVNQYLAKGREVLVEGRMNPDDNVGPRIWTRQDGTPAASYEITAQTVRFLGGRGDSSGSSGGDSSGATVTNTDFDFGDLNDDDFLDF